MDVGFYALALRLYPPDYLARFGREMLTTYTDVRRHHRGDTRVCACVSVREFAGLAVGVVGEWVAKWRDDPAARGRVLPDCRMMRPVGVTRGQWAAGLDGY